jgi:electron transfer flavoprotein beta subunit
VKIAVCIKRVPEMDVKFKIASSGTAVDETGLKFDMSDFDGYAVEFALQTTEQLGAGDVTVISLGTDAVQETLRKALSMGVARAVHLKVDSVPADGFSIAQALAAELKNGAYDLVLFGKHAADTASGAVGLMTAELLGIPMVQACTKLSFENGRGTARREVEGGAEIVNFPLPAAASIDEGIARPRYPSLKGIMAAKKKPLDIKPTQLAAPRLTITKLEMPPGTSRGRFPARRSPPVRRLSPEGRLPASRRGWSGRPQARRCCRPCSRCARPCS